MSKQKLRVESKNELAHATSRKELEIHLLIDRLNRRTDRTNFELEMLADESAGANLIQDCIENYLSFWQITINVYALLVCRIFELKFEKNDNINFEKVQKRLKENKTSESDNCRQIWQRYGQDLKRTHHAHLRNVVQHEGTLDETQFDKLFEISLQFTELTLRFAIFNDDESRLEIEGLKKSLREYADEQARKYKRHLRQTVKMFQETVDATDHLWKPAEQPKKPDGKLKQFLEGDDILDSPLVQ